MTKSIVGREYNEAVAHNKTEQSTYDMNEEECTNKSNIVSTSTISRFFGERTSLDITPCETSSSGETWKGFEFSDEKKKEEEVSWSYSDGSTYVSEFDRRGNDAHSREVNWEKSSHGDLFEKTQKKDPEAEMLRQRCSVQYSPRVDQTRTYSSTHAGKMLENVEYYSDLNIASNDDALSVVGFISKEDTEAVFCRRLVPLEIPIRQQKPRDDVSAISSPDEASLMAVRDQSSEQAVRIRRRPTFTRLPADEVRMSTKMKNDGDEVVLDGIIEVTFDKIQHRLENASFSTLSSSSKVSDLAIETSSLMDQNGDHAVRPHSLHLQEKSEESGNEESPMEARMRYLQERIRQMQVKSTMERLPDHNSKSQSPLITSSQHQEIIEKTDEAKSDNDLLKIPDQADHDQRTNTGPAARQARVRDRVQELKSRLKRQGLEDSGDIRPQIYALPEKKIQLLREKGKQDGIETLSIPSEVREANAENEMSTICCDLNEDSLDEIDLEGGSIYNQKSGKKMQDFSDIRGKVSHFLYQSKGKLESFEWFQTIQAMTLRLWMKHVHGKTRTERLILAILLLSSFVLFILLIAIIAQS